MIPQVHCAVYSSHRINIGRMRGGALITFLKELKGLTGMQKRLVCINEGFYIRFPVQYQLAFNGLWSLRGAEMPPTTSWTASIRRHTPLPAVLSLCNTSLNNFAFPPLR